MDKTKVLQIISSSNAGGAEKLFYSVLKYLDNEKFDVYVVCPPDSSMLGHFEKYAKEIKTLNFNSCLSKLRAIFSLRAYIKQKKIDIVHTHLIDADLVGAVATRFAERPYLLSTIHGYNFSTTGEFDLRSIKNSLLSVIYRLIYIVFDEVIAVCKVIKEDLARRPGIKVAAKKIRIINSAVDFKGMSDHIQRKNSDFKHALDDNYVRYVGVIANLDKIKCHRVLLRSIPQILRKETRIKFLFAGEGKERKRLAQMARKLNIEDNVVFLGFLEHIAEIISMCELIVLPSLLESRPLVLMEAMALGKPVVATRVGGIPEIVENGKTGLLVSPKSSTKLANAILLLLQNKELIVKMGQNGQIKADGLFSLEDMIGEIEKVYLGRASRKVGAP